MYVQRARGDLPPHTDVVKGVIRPCNEQPENFGPRNWRPNQLRCMGERTVNSHTFPNALTPYDTLLIRRLSAYSLILSRYARRSSQSCLRVLRPIAFASSRMLSIFRSMRRHMLAMCTCCSFVIFLILYQF